MFEDRKLFVDPVMLADLQPAVVLLPAAKDIYDRIVEAKERLLCGWIVWCVLTGCELGLELGFMQRSFGEWLHRRPEIRQQKDNSWRLVA